jgi:hypothetical protein
MSFPTNTSPYESQGLNLPSSPHYLGGPPQSPGWGGRAWQAIFGKPEQNYRQSNLGSEQAPLYQNLLNAGSNSFGTAGDYYRNLLSNNNSDMDAFAAPELRRFQEDIVPGLAEQFASMGYGGTSGSGFRNAALRAGTDLSERLGAIRANLRQSAAQGLQNIGSFGLNTGFGENINRPETHGLLGELTSAAGTALGTAGSIYLGNKVGSSIGNAVKMGRGGLYPDVKQAYDPYGDQ